MRRKLLIISFIFILFTFSLFNTFSFAVNYSTEFTEIYDYFIWDTFNNNVINNRPYFILYKDNNYYFYIYPCDEHFTSWNFETDDIYFYINNDVLTCRNSTLNEETADFARYMLNDRSYSRSIRCSSNGDEFLFSDIIVNNYKICLSIPIYSDIDKSEVFFNPPIGELAPIIGKIEMFELTMNEILFLLPVLIVLVVSFIALRKGIIFIKKLKTS